MRWKIHNFRIMNVLRLISILHIYVLLKDFIYVLVVQMTEFRFIPSSYGYFFLILTALNHFELLNVWMSGKIKYQYQYFDFFLSISNYSFYHSFRLQCHLNTISILIDDWFALFPLFLSYNIFVIIIIYYFFGTYSISLPEDI